MKGYDIAHSAQPSIVVCPPPPDVSERARPTVQDHHGRGLPLVATDTLAYPNHCFFLVLTMPIALVLL